MPQSKVQAQMKPKAEPCTQGPATLRCTSVAIVHEATSTGVQELHVFFRLLRKPSSEAQAQMPLHAEPLHLGQTSRSARLVMKISQADAHLVLP